jgi:hypothetical protein
VLKLFERVTTQIVPVEKPKGDGRRRRSISRKVLSESQRKEIKDGQDVLAKPISVHRRRARVWASAKEQELRPRRNETPRPSVRGAKENTT